jgi:hypothetical protein
MNFYPVGQPRRWPLTRRKLSHLEEGASTTDRINSPLDVNCAAEGVTQVAVTGSVPLTVAM